MTRFAVNQSNGANSFPTNARVPRIGELLVAANIIKPEVLNESLQIAKISKTLIGRTLISVGQLDEHKLQAALDIQTLIRKRMLDSKLAIKALNVACISKISADEALQSLGWLINGAPRETHENEFAQLMINSGLVSPEIIAIAEQQSKENHLPLGRCLVVNRYMTQNRLEAVLIAQALIRDKSLSEDQALKALRTSLQNKEPIERSLMQFGIRQLGESDKRMLEMLNLAGIITETGKLTVLETSLTEDRTCNDILIDSAMVNTEILDKALTLQTLILTENLTLKHAAKILRKSQLEILDLELVGQDLQARNKTAAHIEQLLDLLKGSGILNESVISTAKKLSKTSGIPLGDILISENEIDNSHIDAAWQAQRMVDDRMIGFDYACSALRKISGNNKQSLTNIAQGVRELPPSEIPPENLATNNWLMKFTKKLFKK